MCRARAYGEWLEARGGRRRLHKLTARDPRGLWGPHSNSTRGSTTPATVISIVFVVPLPPVSLRLPTTVSVPFAASIPVYASTLISRGCVTTRCAPMFAGWTARMTVACVDGVRATGFRTLRRGVGVRLMFNPVCVKVVPSILLFVALVMSWFARFRGGEVEEGIRSGGGSGSYGGGCS